LRDRVPVLTRDRVRPLATLIVLIGIAVLSGPRLPAQSRAPATPRIPAAALAHVRALGKTRVIVGVDAPFTPEPALPTPAAVRNQRASIAQAQTAVLARIVRVNPASVRRFQYIPFLALEVDEGDLQTLAMSPEVTAIEIDAVAGPTLAESTPLVGATRAWASGFTGAGWTVAVLDSGIDKTHPFLSGKVISEACYSTFSAQSTSVCPDGTSASTAVGSAVPCSMADCVHGTHVAGIAAGKGVSFSGVAKDASLISVQVFSSFFNSADCGGRSAPCALSFFSDEILGLERVYALRSTYNIAAVNISIGGDAYTSPCDATFASMKSIIDQLRAANIATVIASGNGGRVDALAAPACISTAISVASTTDGSSAPADLVSDFSNTNQYLSLFAPGQTILSSVPGGGFSNFNGTSMAAPHVAGAWAVIKSKKASATVAEILNALSTTGTPILDPGNGITKPRINVDLALQVFPNPCAYTVSPTHFDVGPEQNVVGVNVITQGACPWTVSTLSPFLSASISSGGGAGSGAALIVHLMNTTAFSRDGAVNVAGTIVTISQRRRIGQADVNGDGRADLFWQNGGDGGLATWYLDGWNVLGTGYLDIAKVADLNWRVVGSGDLDGDGRVDLVWQHQTQGWLAVWIVHGTHVFNTAFLSINQVADLNWQIKGVDDIDGDGKADLIWQHKTEGWVAAWLMDGSQVRSTQFLSINQVPDTDWEIVGAGDTNGDGYADLLWQHRTQGWLAVWFMRATNVVSTNFLSVNRITDSNWHIRAVGDVDANNYADIIWQNDVTGGLGVWTLNGATVTSQRGLSIDRVSDLNWRIVGPG
jgi:subtilisin